MVIIAFVLATSCSQKSPTEAGRLTIDSLLVEIQDSIKTNIPYARQKINHALQITNDSFLRYKLLSFRSYCFLMTDSLDTAHLLIRQIIKKTEVKPKEPLLYDIMAYSYDLNGIYFTLKDSYDSAFTYFRKAYDAACLGTDKKHIPDLCINLADAYFKKSDFSNSASYFRKALLYSDSLQTTEEMRFPIYFGLGQVYLSLRDFELSDYYFNLAEKDLDKRSISERFTFCNNRGNYYYYAESYPEALRWFIKARDVVTPRNYTFFINFCELNMSDVYLKLGQLDSAQHYANKIEGFFRQVNHRSALYYITTVKAGVALKKHNTALASSIFKSNSDTLGIEKSVISIRNKLLQDYYEQVGDYKQAYQFLLKNHKIENDVQSERVKGRVAEIDLRYKQDTTMMRRDFLIKDQKEKLTNLKLSRYLLLSVILIILIVIVFLFFYMKKQRYLLHLQHIGQIAKLRIENTRNRISPHFLFNALSTIKGEIADKPGVSERLHAIISMLRSSLLNVEKPYITLSQEIGFVNNYILLQKAQFISDLQAEVNIENEGLCEYKVPAMIIQIPVENAIKHGLAGKESGDKILKVDAFREDDSLRVTIKDNGIGREKARKSHPGIGTGTGLKVISQTIHLLNNKNEKKIRFTLTDLKDDAGNSCGTQVEIDIPVVYNFEL